MYQLTKLLHPQSLICDCVPGREDVRYAHIGEWCSPILYPLSGSCHKEISFLENIVMFSAILSLQVCLMTTGYVRAWHRREQRDSLISPLECLECQRTGPSRLSSRSNVTVSTKYINMDCRFFEREGRNLKGGKSYELCTYVGSLKTLYRTNNDL
jgi:hypothetical protein